MADLVDYLLSSQGGAPASAAPTASLASAFAQAQNAATAAPAGSSGSSTGGSTGGGTTPPASIDPSQIEGELTGSVYPDIQQAVLNSWAAQQHSQGGLIGETLQNVNDTSLPGAGGAALNTAIDVAFPALGAVQWVGAFLSALMGGDPKPQPPNPTDYPWSNSPAIIRGSPNTGSQVTGFGSLPPSSSSYASLVGLTPAQLSALGPGLADAYPFGQGVGFTPGTGVYATSANPAAVTSNAFGSGPNYPGFWEPGSVPDTYFATNYFGQVSGPAESFFGPTAPIDNGSGVFSPGLGPLAPSTAGDAPLGIGAPTPAWLGSLLSGWGGQDAGYQAAQTQAGFASSEG